MLALTRPCVLAPAATFLRRRGAPVRRLLAMAGLPAWILQRGEGLIPTVAASRFLHIAARREGLEGFGLLSGQEGRLDALGVLGRMTYEAPTLGDALRVQLDDHRAFSSHGRLWLAPDGNDLEWCWSVTGRVDETWRQTDHYLIMLMIGLVRLAAEPSWRPARIRFQSDASSAVREVDLLANAAIAFAQPVSSVTFPRALLRAPLRVPCPVRRMDPTTLAEWRASAPADDFVGAVTQIVETLAWDGYPRLGATANLIGTSSRTLQRHLAAHGTGHDALVERARLGAAATLLAETSARVLDVALDAGYSDHAHFTRAFRRWSGATPMQFRRAHRNGRPTQTFAGTGS